MKLKRQEKGLRPELTELKDFARKNSIYFNNESSNEEIFTELYTKILEDTSEVSQNFLSELIRIRKEIIQETISNPLTLIKWFYENQGVRRFDAANRFFVVLIDMQNFEDSWKLKRNKKLLQEKIENYLDRNRSLNFENFKLDFSWDGRIYTTYATTLFILKE